MSARIVSSLSKPTLPPAAGQEPLTSQVAPLRKDTVEDTIKDTVEMRPQKAQGCWAGLQEKILQFFRWVVSCLCCRSPKAQPAPVNPTTDKKPIRPILPYEASFDKGPTVSKWDYKNKMDNYRPVIPIEEMNKRWRKYFKEYWPDAYSSAKKFKNFISSQPVITAVHVHDHFKDLPDPVKILVVALQATPEGYAEGKIRIFYPQLDAAYRWAAFPPYKIPEANILHLQNHLFRQAKSVLLSQLIESLPLIPPDSKAAAEADV